MTRTEHLLFILAEECAEVGQRCSKAARFTLNEKQAENKITPESELTSESTLSNAQRITYELSQLIGVAEMLICENLIPDILPEIKLAKSIKVEEFLQYSEKVGTLNGG